MTEAEQDFVVHYLEECVQPKSFAMCGRKSRGETMIGIGVIGYGYWGPNLVRNFVEVPDAYVVSVSDLQPRRLESVRNRYPSVETTTNPSELLADPRIDAIAIATPVFDPFRVGIASLASRANMCWLKNHWPRRLNRRSALSRKLTAAIWY
jgi:hypothetical protein